MINNLSSVQIAGINIYNFIVENNYLEYILDKMHIVNYLDSRKVRRDNTIRELYTRCFCLRGKIIYLYNDVYEYDINSNCIVNYNCVEEMTALDLKNILIQGDYPVIISIANEIWNIISLNKYNKLLKK